MFPHLIMCCPPSCSAIGSELGPGNGSLLEVGLQQMHNPATRGVTLIHEGNCSVFTWIRVILVLTLQPEPQHLLGSGHAPGGHGVLNKGNNSAREAHWIKGNCGLKVRMSFHNQIILS